MPYINAFKKIQIILLSASSILMTTTRVNAETYFCNADMSAGFVFENGNWRTANFKSDDKFTISSDNIEKTIYTLNYLGSSSKIIECKRSKYRGDLLQNIRCDSGFSRVDMDTKTLRFQSVYYYGYVNGSDTRGDTPSITIGKCSQIKD